MYGLYGDLKVPILKKIHPDWLYTPFNLSWIAIVSHGELIQYSKYYGDGPIRTTEYHRVTTMVHSTVPFGWCLLASSRRILVQKVILD